MNRIDKDAMERAIEAARAESAARATQIDSKLQDESWERVAQFASYCVQGRVLNLQPWQKPPCHASLADLDQPYDDPRGARESAELLKRLIDANLSPYEPDPMAALERAEAEQRLAAK
jgi:hypothetical protein